VAASASAFSATAPLSGNQKVTVLQASDLNVDVVNYLGLKPNDTHNSTDTTGNKTISNYSELDLHSKSAEEPAEVQVVHE
jgi:hypothetical protein